MSLVRTIRRFEWDMAHRIPNHKGKCARLHGHRYVLELSVEGSVQYVPGASDEGMVIDFDELDEIIKDVIGAWDHRTMLYDGDVITIGKVSSEARSREDIEEELGVFRVRYIPTAENIAAYIRAVVSRRSKYTVSARVWETPKGSAEAF